jgi:uncharacterized protein (DUF58 family)
MSRLRAGRGETGSGVRLTARGVALTMTVVLVLTCAALAGIQELYVVGAVTLTLLCLAGATVAVQPIELTSTRHVLPGQVAAGESAVVALTVVNEARRRSPPATLLDPFDRGRHVAGFGLGPLRPGEELSSYYDLPPTPRGRYVVGPLRISVTDPFGLVRRTVLGAPSAALIVHPRLIHLESPARRHGFDRFGAGRRGSFEPGGEEFAALRPYHAGDDLRHVHWPSTARTEQVMVRQTDAAAEPRSAVAFDLRAGLWSPAGLEEAISAAGGILEAAHRAGMEIRLLSTASDTHGPLDTGFGRSTAHWSRVLEGLATAQASPSGSIPAPLVDLLGPAGQPRGRRGEDTLVVVTSSAAQEIDLRALGRLAPEDSLIVAVFGPRPVPMQPSQVPGRLVQVEELSKFAAAWDRLWPRPDRVSSR